MIKAKQGEKKMQSGARYQAVLDLITEVFKDEKPADGIINDYLRARKYIGSKDRRFITETVWEIIRRRMKLEFDAASKDPRKVLLVYAKDKLQDVFDESQYGLSPLSEDEKEWLNHLNEDVYPDYVEAECPAWIFNKLKNMELFKALNRPASANFRVNFKSRDEVIERMKGEGYTLFPTAYSPIGLRSEERISLGNCIAYQEGMLEVQDEASQLAALLCDVQPEHKVIDYCCGAGGKSLTLAHLLRNKGRILAHDISDRRLEAIKPRLQRLGVQNIELTDIIATTDRDYDRFILDAPCSGTGTWRRSPDAKFRLSEKWLKKLNTTQAELLQIAYEKTKKTGRIIYMTCSILQEENENIIDNFLRLHDDVKLLNIKELWQKRIDTPYPGNSERYLKMSPLVTGTDGFFVCVMEKNI